MLIYTKKSNYVSNSGCSFIFCSQWKLFYDTYFTALILRHLFYDKYYYNMRQIFFYKMGQTLQNASAFLLQNAANFYCKMRECYYKMRQLLQNETILLQNATAIIKWVVTSVHSCFQKLFSIICLIAQNKWKSTEKFF